MAINWEKEFQKFFQRHNPARLQDLQLICRDFAGYEESLWLSLQRRYGDTSVPEVISAESTKKASARARVIRIYAHYAPQKLQEIDQTMMLMMQDGPAKVFDLLTQKYGPEPLPEEMTVRERALAMFATYKQLDRMNQLEEMMQLYQGMEEQLIRRLVSELGPEPDMGEGGDPREPRNRLRRIFMRYDREVVSKADLVLERYEGNFVEMFATMQRRYGREPTESDVRQYLEDEKEEREKERREAEQARMEEETNRRIEENQTKEQREEAKRERGKEALRRMAKVTSLLEDTAQFVIPRRYMPDNWGERPKVVDTIRNHVVHGDVVPQQTVVDLSREVFRNYDRDLLVNYNALVRERFGNVQEFAEWLSFLDNSFYNARPYNTKPSLRTVASLLEMKLGNVVEEISVAGGVGPFLAGVDSAGEEEWANYLTTTRGEVTEAELATRNRLRTHYLTYNRRKSIVEADRVIADFKGDTMALYEALVNQFGPEPPPVSVKMNDVVRILQRYAPHKIQQADTVVEAHCYFGDTPAEVIQRVERTYGKVPGPFEAAVERLSLTEFEMRFRLFSHEMRLREILIRRRMSEHQEGGWMHFMQETLHIAAASHVTQSEHDVRERLGDLEKEELKARQQIIESAAKDFKDMLDTLSVTVTNAEEEINFELTEMLAREAIVDQWAPFYPPMAEQMHTEKETLMVWLGERLLWRQKWAEDENRLRQAQIREELDLQEAERVRKAKMELELSKPSLSVEHQAAMESLYKKLNEQSQKVLRFNSTVELKRRDPKLPRMDVEVPLGRHGHAGCRFHDPNYKHVEPINYARLALQNSYHPPAFIDGQEISTDDDWGLYFREQMRDYLKQLFEKYEPASVGKVDRLLQENYGQESELVAALEQQYDVSHWRVQNLRDRVTRYYEVMAPNRMEEITVLLNKFSGKEEMMWQYLIGRYGPVPALQTEEMRGYLKDRLVRYLALRAPHLLRDADRILGQCEGNGDNIFIRLTSEYGPEDDDITKDLLRRKLITFYKRRGITSALRHVDIISDRFAGRQQLLRSIIKAKFNDILDHYEPDVETRPDNRRRQSSVNQGPQPGQSWYAAPPEEE